MKKKANNLIKILLFINLFSGCSHPSENISSVNTNSISSSNDLIEESVSSFDNISSIESSIVESSSSTVFVESSLIVESSSENINTSLSSESLSSTITSSEVSINENTSSINSSFESVSSSIKTDVDFSNTTLAFLGDSITYGYVTKQGGQYANPWPKLVGETLEVKESINYGIGGTNIAKVEGKTNSFVERYTTMDNNIDIIGVMGGTNDWGNNGPLGTIDDIDETTIYGALNLIASGLKEKYPNSYIFFMSPIPRKETWVNSQGYKMKDVRDAFLNVANKYDLGFLDMYYLSGFENEMKLDTTDGVHPSQELISTSFAPQISKFIKENYKK